MFGKCKNDFFDKHYYRLAKVFTWICGIWPYQPILSKIFWFSLIFIPTFSLASVESWEMYRNRSDINEIVEIFPALAVALISLTKICGFIANNKKIKILIDLVKENWKTYSSREESEIIIKYASFGGKLTIAYAIYMLMACVFFLLEPFIFLITKKIDSANTTELIGLPLRAYYGIETEKIYIFALLHANLTSFILVLIITAIDSIYILLVQHACSMFVILGNWIERVAIVEGSNYDLHPRKSDDKNYSTLLRCFYLHNNMLQFSEILESALTIPFLFEMGLHVIMMSITGVQTVMHINILSEAARFITFTLAQMLHVMWICWLAQTLKDYSSYINISICRGYWYKTSERSKQLLKLMLIRSSFPCTLTAGKIFTLSMEGFSTILRTAMSYFTVLKSVQ